MNQVNFNLLKGSLSRKKQAAGPADRQAPTQQEVEELFTGRITPETVLPPMQPLFEMFGVPCFYRGELVADCGKAKSGKTFFLSILMAACLTEKVLALERHTENKPLRVLWVDTEQSQQSTQDILVNRIIPLTNSVCDIDSSLFAFNLRGLGFEKRAKMVDVAIRTLAPDIAIIDGIKDLMTNINDADQATMIMEQLMDLAKAVNCCIVCVLHQNKSESDRNMRGSIGTELTNKAFEVYQCEFLERRDMFKVTQTLSRKKRIKEAIGYRLNEKGLPESCELPPEQPRDDNGRWTKAECDLDSEELKALFNKAMEGRTQRPFNEVMAVALKKCEVPDVTTYYMYLKEALEQGIINKVTVSDTNKQWIELTDEGMLPF